MQFLNDSFVRESTATGRRASISYQSYQETSKVQGGCRRSNLYSGLRSLGEEDLWANCSLLGQTLPPNSNWMACGHRPGRHFNPITKYPASLSCLSQPIQALEHPKFKELIDVASHATNGIKISGWKGTWGEIKHLFKDHITRLKAQLNVNIFLNSHFFPSFCRVRLSKAKSA